MPRRAPLAALLATALLSPAARANVTVQGTGTATAGWSDNILSAPDQPTTNGAPRQSDLLFQLIPGIVVSSVAPRIMQRLAYTFTADLFARHSEANSYSNTLDWVGDVKTSPTTSLILTLESQQGKVSTFNLNQASSGATVGALPSNNNLNFFSQTAGDTFEATPQPNWRISQTLLFRAFIPIERGTLPDSYDLTGAVGFDRIFGRNAFGPQLRLEFIDFAQPRSPTTDVPVAFDQRELVTALTAHWRRDWSLSWTSELAAGAISIVGLSADPTASTQTEWEPSGLAALRWTKEIGSAEIRYVHDVGANALAGALFSTDEVALQGGFPIVRANLFLGATVAYQHVRRLSLLPGTPDLSADLALVDFTITWQPIRELRVFARYSLFDQFGTPPVGDVPSLLPDLTRSTVLVGVNVFYPATAATIRVASQRGTRVDRSDEAGFPEMHAQPPR